MDNKHEIEYKLNISKIFFAWIMFGIILGAIILFKGGFMAGAATLVIIMAVITIVFAAPIHMLFAKRLKVSDIKGHLKIIIGIITALFLIFVLLGISGVFNFT